MVVALRDVDLSIHLNECMAIMGVLVRHNERLALRRKRRVIIGDSRSVGDERDPHKFARANWGAWSIDQSSGGLAPEVGDLLEQTVDHFQRQERART